MVANNAEEELDEQREHDVAAAGGAARSVLRSFFLSAAKRASIGQLPIRHADAYKSSTSRLMQGGVFAYKFGKNAFLGGMLFECHDKVAALLEESSGGLHHLMENPLLHPAIAGFAAGAWHGFLEHSIDKAEGAAQRGLSGVSVPTRAQVVEGTFKCGSHVATHAVTHSVLFGMYGLVFKLAGPHKSELRDDASLRSEYRHLFVTTATAGLSAGLCQEWVNSMLVGVRLRPADLLKSGAASAIGFLAFEYARFEHESNHPGG